MMWLLTYVISWVLIFLAVRVFKSIAEWGNAPRVFKIVIFGIWFIPFANVIMALVFLIFSIVAYFDKKDDDDLPNIKFFG